jgi:peptide/nickel transport system permease protein
MWKYIFNRTLQIIVTLVIFFALTYFILDAQPGDITLQYVDNPKFTAEQREAMQVRLGLDKPVIERFVTWMGNTLKGDLGDSYLENRPVMEIIGERAPRTIFLFLTAAILQFIIGNYLGKLLAWSRDTVMEYGVTLVGAITSTVFMPWFALMMIWFFGFTLKWFPLGKFLDPLLWRKIPDEANINANIIFNNLLLTCTLAVIAYLLVLFFTRRMNKVQAKALRVVLGVVIIGAFLGLWAAYQYGNLAMDILKHLVLPVATLTIVNFAGTMLLTRTTMLETLREDYIMATRAKGLPERVVRDKHAARNALLPVFTNFIINLPFIIGGGIITETIFSWPGLGLTLLNASNSGDIPMVMGAFLFIGVLALAAHLFADIAYAFLDPRIRYA